MTTTPAISGVQVVPLRLIADERGAVMHMLRRDAPHFTAFGEIYFSLVNPGVVKGWKKHRTMTLNLAVPSGRIRLVLLDERRDSPTSGAVMDLEVGAEAEIYHLIVIPPGIWTAFQSIGEGAALVANCASIPHDPLEAENRPLTDPPVKIAW